jgi:hypothetical protein
MLLIAVAVFAEFARVFPSLASAERRDAPTANQSVAAVDSIRRVISSPSSTLTVELNRRSSQIAEPIELILILDAPRDTEVRFANMEKRIGPFHVVRVDQWESIPIGDGRTRRQWIQAMTIESLRPGAQVLPSIGIEYRRAESDGDWRKLESGPIEVTINSLAADADPEQFRDIKGVVAIPAVTTSNRLGLVPVVLGLSFVTVALAAAILRWRRRRISPRLRACRAVAMLRADYDLSPRSDREIYADLTAILRRYVAERFGIEAETQTGEEMIQGLRTSLRGKDELVESLAEFVDAANRAKFSRVSGPERDASSRRDHAAAGSGSDSVKRSIRAVEQFIDATGDEAIGGRATR